MNESRTTPQDEFRIAPEGSRVIVEILKEGLIKHTAARLG